jgi:hypothetical protein
VTDLKLAIITAVEFFDHFVLGHRFHWFCCWVTWHPWQGNDE